MLEKRRVAPLVPSYRPSRSAEKRRNSVDSDACDSGTLPSAVPQPGPSNVFSKLSALSKRVSPQVEQDAPVRTTSFADKPRWAPVSEHSHLGIDVDPLCPIIQ